MSPTSQAKKDVFQHLTRFRQHRGELSASEIGSILVSVMLVKDEFPEQARAIHRDEWIQELVDHCSHTCDTMDAPVLSNVLWALDQLYTLDAALPRISHSGPTAMNATYEMTSNVRLSERKCNPLLFLGSISRCLHSAATALFSIPAHREYCQLPV